MLSPDYLDRCADETLGMSDELSTSLAAAVGISLVSLENLTPRKQYPKQRRSCKRNLYGVMVLFEPRSMLLYRMRSMLPGKRISAPRMRG